MTKYQIELKELHEKLNKMNDDEIVSMFSQIDTSEVENWKELECFIGEESPDLVKNPK